MTSLDARLSGPAASTGAALPVDAAHVIGAILLVGFPLVASPFFTFQIGAYSLVLGTIALSVMVLGGYGGMVSLAQMMVAGIAGYTIAILGHNGSNVMGLGWPWWLAVPVAILFGSVAGALIGALAVRTAGIYTIMITLAIATAFFYFVRQNYALFNGFNGFHGVEPPTLFGLYLHDPVPFYYVSLAVAVFFYGATVYGERSTFGLSLQALRDNPRRMRALGFNVPAHRIFAFFLAGLIASTAGVLMVWFNSQISPGSVSVSAAIDSLVVAVVGGIRRPIGAFPRRIAVRSSSELRGRPRRSGSLQHGDRPRLPGRRVLLARRAPWTDREAAERGHHRSPASNHRTQSTELKRGGQK